MNATVTLPAFSQESAARVMTTGKILSRRAKEAAFQASLDALLDRAMLEGDRLDQLTWITQHPLERRDYAHDVVSEAIRVLHERLTDSERNTWRIFLMGEAVHLYDAVEAKHAAAPQHARVEWQDQAA